MLGVERFDIDALAVCDLVPDESEMPGTPWYRDVKLGEKYKPAFEVATTEDAKSYLLMLVGHALRFEYVYEEGQPVRGLTWREAFAQERVWLAWWAFFKDGKNEYNEQVGWYRVEEKEGQRVKTVARRWRDFVVEMYGVVLPETLRPVDNTLVTPEGFVQVDVRRDVPVLEKMLHKRSNSNQMNLFG